MEAGILENKLKQLANSLGLVDNIIFIGGIPNKFVGNEFSKGLVSISSSIDEAYGLVNIEALKGRNAINLY